jgi:hypothetical protein
LFTHRSKLLIIGAVLTAALCATLLLEAPEATRSVDEVMGEPEHLQGREIAIRGEVRDGTVNEELLTFILHGDSEELLVDFSKATVSNGLDDNRTIYAEGILLNKNGQWVFEADVIKTSCPSKYEDATED